MWQALEYHAMRLICPLLCSYLCLVKRPWHVLHTTRSLCSGASSGPPLLIGSRWSTVRSRVVPHTSHHGRLLRTWLLNLRHAGSKYGLGLPSFHRLCAAARCVWHRLPTIVSTPQSKQGRWKVTPSGTLAAAETEQSPSPSDPPRARRHPQRAARRLPTQSCRTLPPKTRPLGQVGP